VKNWLGSDRQSVPRICQRRFVLDDWFGARDHSSQCGPHTVLA
jgi:hypothetical protein